MKLETIIEIINKASLNIDDFYIGKGAYTDSQIRMKLNPNIGNANCLKYAIQFAKNQDVFVVWEVSNRIEKQSSLSLHWTPDSVKWKDIDLTDNNICIIKQNVTGLKKVLLAAIVPLNIADDFFHNFEICFGVNNNTNEFQSEIETYPVVKKTREGAKIEFFGTRYERNPLLRDAAIKCHGLMRNICGFDFYKQYGEIGKDYIEVHHLKPLGTVKEEHDINPQTDLRCLCANCHRIVHRKRYNVYSIHEIKKIVQHPFDF